MNMNQNEIERMDVSPGGMEAESLTPYTETEEDEVPRKPKRKIKKIIVPLVLVAIVAAVAVYFFGGSTQPAAQASGSYINYTVDQRDVTLTLSGTGSLSPANSYTVTTLISGEILSAGFEEGDIVEKDSILYEVDSSDVSTSIEQSELSLEQSRRSYEQKLKSLEDLNIKANESGAILKLNVELGDKVSAGQAVATIRNSATMSLEIPFGSDDVAGFYIGQSAEVTLDGSFERLTGTINKIGAVEERLDGNMLVRYVTIDVSNPGGIAVGQAATAMVGSIACNGSGTFAYKGESTVTAAISGEVSAIYVSEGDTVGKDQLIVVLSSDSLQNEVTNSSNSLRDSELSLENRYKQLEDYTITSPISGTIIEKNYKEGDTLESGKTLCTIFDLSYLTMTLYVDELDISQVEVGQAVTVTAEALSGRTFQGYVTKVNINGTTTSGTTSYPVEIRIDKTDDLLPGMNVQAEIVVSSSVDVVAIPVSALQRGNRVLVQTDDTASGTDETTGLPNGFTFVEVTPGSSDGSFIEITSGLNAGDVIAYVEETVSSDLDFSSMNGEMMVFEVNGNAGGGAMPQQGQSVRTAGPGGGF